VLRHSRAPVEVLFLEVGSLDGTAEYLDGIADAASVRVEVVRATTDHGIPAACRQMLAQARGEYLVLLNNDTAVPPGWLEQLVAVAKQLPDVGLVGPMSNCAAPPQWVESVPYRLQPKNDVHGTDDGPRSSLLLDLAPVDRFAEEWRWQHRGQCQETDRLGGFCLLIKRQVLADVELLQAQSGLEVFDTDALCLRALQAGYKLACCRDLFIHNFGSRSYPRRTLT
jgi:GT2 family glycosyltransferase